MSDDFDYDSFLEADWAAIPEVSDLPDGRWVWKAQTPTFRKGEGNRRSAFVVPMRAKEPVEVDQDALDDLPDDFAPADIRAYHEIVVEKPSDMQRVKQFLASVGLDVDGKLGDSIAALKDHEFEANATYETYKKRDGSEGRNLRVSRFGAVGAE